MKPFSYQKGELWGEKVPLTEVLASHGSPLYVYSRQGFVDRFQRLRDAFGDLDPLICYSVKANSHLAILSLLKEEGSGFDVVSGGERFRAEKVGAPPEKVVFAGVGKTAEEIRYALEKGVLMFNVESTAEARKIDEVASSMDTRAPIALRLNPDVDPRTHKKITTGKKENKFGIDLLQAQNFIAEELSSLGNLDLVGIHLHIGSQIQSSGPYQKAIGNALEFIEDLKEKLPPHFQYLNIGGGYGIDYKQVEELDSQEFARELIPLVKKSGLKMVMEPGRYISANSGLLLTQVLYTKEAAGGKKFLICDSGMHHLIRPTLYEAYHRIWPLQTEKPFYEAKEEELETYDVVGPICESGDFLAQNCSLPRGIKEGDYLVVFSAGAYGACMASHYNSHSRPREVLLEGENFRLITESEKWEDLVAGESM